MKTKSLLLRAGAIALCLLVVAGCATGESEEQSLEPPASETSAPTTVATTAPEPPPAPSVTEPPEPPPAPPTTTEAPPPPPPPPATEAEPPPPPPTEAPPPSITLDPASVPAEEGDVTVSVNGSGWDDPARRSPLFITACTGAQGDPTVLVDTASTLANCPNVTGDIAFASLDDSSFTTEITLTITQDMIDAGAVVILAGWLSASATAEDAGVGVLIIGGDEEAPPPSITLDPASVPAEEGDVTVSVNGSGWDDPARRSPLFITACTGAQGDPTVLVDTASTLANCPNVTGDIAFASLDDSSFTTEITLTITQDMIDAGAVVILAGWLSASATAEDAGVGVLIIGGDEEAPPPSITLDPASVPAEEGDVTVSVNGSGWDDPARRSPLFITACTGAQGDPTVLVDTASTLANCPNVTGDIAFASLDDSSFTTEITLTITQDMIDAGAVVILAGWLSASATAEDAGVGVLIIGGDEEAPPPSITLDPASVPAEEGDVTVSVNGSGWDDPARRSPLFITACTGAQGDPTVLVDTASTLANCPNVTGDIAFASLDDSSFTTEITLTITQDMIDAGAVVILAGWLSASATAEDAGVGVLIIGGDEEPAAE